MQLVHVLQSAHSSAEQFAFSSVLPGPRPSARWDAPCIWEEPTMQGNTVVTVARLIAAVVATAATTLAAGQNSVNVGRIDPATWVRGPLYAAPATKSIWNPAKLKLMSGGELVL